MEEEFPDWASSSTGLTRLATTARLAWSVDSDSLSAPAPSASISKFHDLIGAAQWHPDQANKGKADGGRSLTGIFLCAVPCLSMVVC